MRTITKPLDGEFAPYTMMYIGLLPDDGHVLMHMDSNMQRVFDLVRPLNEAQRTTPFAAGEWTINEIVLHIADDERIYAYRALRAARGDTTELPGFDQDIFTRCSAANSRSLDSLLDEYASVRAATLTLFANLPDEALTRGIIANGHVMSVRAAAYHIAGHERHHLNSIQQNYGL
ncbi:MAG: DinB family protein [Chloroflexi bacterium]|nr:DinB family protein [Chloroflexota bacterium]MCC6893932.1 DinB family protein [Anaerolineae bacterium]